MITAQYSTKPNADFDAPADSADWVTHPTFSSTVTEATASLTYLNHRGDLDIFATRVLVDGATRARYRITRTCEFCGQSATSRYDAHWNCADCESRRRPPPPRVGKFRARNFFNGGCGPLRTTYDEAKRDADRQLSSAGAGVIVDVVEAGPDGYAYLAEPARPVFDDYGLVESYDRPVKFSSLRDTWTFTD